MAGALVVLSIFGTHWSCWLFLAPWNGMCISNIDSTCAIWFYSKFYSHCISTSPSHIFYTPLQRNWDWNTWNCVKICDDNSTKIFYSRPAEISEVVCCPTFWVGSVSSLDFAVQQSLYHPSFFISKKVQVGWPKLDSA